MNVSDTAYEILPGREKFTASLVGVATRHLLVGLTGDREVQSEPIAVSTAGARSTLLGQSSPGQNPLILFWSGSSLAPFAASYSPTPGLHLLCGKLKRFAGESPTFIKPYPRRHLPNCKAVTMVLHHATTQKATHKMLHWMLDLSVPSGQVR